MKVFLGGTCNNSKWRDKLIPMDYDFLLGIYAFVGVYALAYTIFSIVLAMLHIHLSNAIDWIASIVLSILSIVYVVRLYIKREESIKNKEVK